MGIATPLKLGLFAALLLAGCDALPAPFGRSVAFPSASELPTGFQDGCACVTRRHCPVAEEILGSSDHRNISCRWIERGRLADCRFETRFTEFFAEPDGNITAGEPGPWRSAAVRARLLDDGRWCAEERQ